MNQRFPRLADARLGRGRRRVWTLLGLHRRGDQARHRQNACIFGLFLTDQPAHRFADPLAQGDLHGFVGLRHGGARILEIMLLAETVVGSREHFRHGRNQAALLVAHHRQHA